MQNEPDFASETPAVAGLTNPLQGVANVLAAVGTVHAQSNDLSSSGVLLDRVAAVVNDGLVLRSEVEKQMATVSARIQQSGQQLPPRNVLRQQVLERLVLQELQMQRAERLGLGWVSRPPVSVSVSGPPWLGSVSRPHCLGLEKSLDSIPGNCVYGLWRWGSV